MQKYTSHAYGSVVIMAYGSPSPIYARMINGTWSEQTLITNSDISVASSPHIEIRMEDSVQGRRLVITDPGQNKWYGNILMDTTGDGTLP